MSSPKWLLTVSVSPWWALVASYLSWDSPKLASRSDPDSFKLLLPPCVLECMWFWCVLFKARVSIFHSPLDILKVNSWTSKPNLLGACLPVQIPWLGNLLWNSDPLLLGLKLCNGNYSSFCGPLTWGYESWVYCSYTPLTCLVVPSYLQLSFLVGSNLWHRYFCK